MTTVLDNFDPNKQDKTQLSEIQLFYSDMTIFLTGSTGFVGNLILEKLLRTCSGVKRIYILIREKKGKSIEERFNDLFNNILFERMKKEQPNYLEKISTVVGDCALPNMGIEEQYQEILKNEVNIVIHSAATVRFNETLRVAVNINIMALKDLLKMSKKMRNLKSFVHISTAYSNCAGREIVDEVFYKTPITGDKLNLLVNSLDDDFISDITPILLRDWPNTYAMTKAVAEGEIVAYGKGLPIGVIRPSIIIATDIEPVSGWINNVYGPTGVVAATGVGIMRCTHADPQKIADIVPGDYVSNAVLACAWDIHNQWIEYDNSNKSDSLTRKTFSPPIYNFVSSNTNPVTWGEFSSINIQFGLDMPSSKSIWPVMMIFAPNKYQFMVLAFLLHTIPAIIIDSLAKFTGKTPKMMDAYRKIHKFINILSYFGSQSWQFHNNNTRSMLMKMSELDKSLFHFDIAKLDWNTYFKKHVRGVRKYIMNESEDTIPAGKKRLQRLYVVYYTILAVLTALLLLMSYKLVKLFI